MKKLLIAIAIFIALGVSITTNSCRSAKAMTYKELHKKKNINSCSKF